MTSEGTSLSAALRDAAGALAVGHQPAVALTPQDEALFRAFQSNLLSLISHELRTPLMGVLNALSVLEERQAIFPAEPGEGLPIGELFRMAKQNAVRLNQTLSTLLDMAAIESGTFHPRLKEVDLGRLIRGRFENGQYGYAERAIGVDWGKPVDSPVLADPQKLGRAFELCFQAIANYALSGTILQVRISSARVDLEFSLDPAKSGDWTRAAEEGKLAFDSGVGSPASAFGGVLQSEQAFLTRREEGLGSEILLIHHLMKLHQGRFELSQKKQDDSAKITLSFVLPALDSEQALRAVLSSRAFYVSSELGAVALILLAVPEGLEVETFCAAVKKSLFRSSDAVYALASRKEVALVLDDCKLEDTRLVMDRLEKTVHRALKWGIAQCPSDGLDPKYLLDLAQERLEKYSQV